MTQGKHRVGSGVRPGHPGDPTGDALASAAGEALAELVRAMKKLAESGADVRRVHRLRSSGRRLESHAGVLRALGVDLSSARLARAARRRAGVLRDLDIVAAELRLMRGVGDLERSAMLAKLGSQRERKASDLERWCRRHAGELPTPGRFMREIHRRIRRVGVGAVRRVVLASVEESIAELAPLLPHAGDSAEALHKVRIASKKLRHAMELAIICAASTRERRDLSAALRHVKSMTKVCGLAQDAEVTLGVLSRAAARAPMAFPALRRNASRLCLTRQHRAVRLVGRAAPMLERALRPH